MGPLSPLGARGPSAAAWRGSKVESTSTSPRSSTPRPDELAPGRADAVALTSRRPLGEALRQLRPLRRPAPAGRGPHDNGAGRDGHPHHCTRRRFAPGRLRRDRAGCAAAAPAARRFASSQGPWPASSAVDRVRVVTRARRTPERRRPGHRPAGRTEASVTAACDRTRRSRLTRSRRLPPAGDFAGVTSAEGGHPHPSCSRS